MPQRRLHVERTYRGRALDELKAFSFLREPKAECALIGEARMLKLGPRLAFADVKIMSEGYSREEDIVAQATVTYAIPG